MFYLKDKRCYLSGAIEYSQEDNWRDLPKQILTEKFGVKRARREQGCMGGSRHGAEVRGKK